MKVLEGKDRDLRRRMLAKIHIAKKEAKVCKLCGAVHFGRICPECGSVYSRRMVDFDYRLFLFRITGKKSAKDMSIYELAKVLEAFKKAGFESAKKMSFEEAAWQTKKGMLKKIKEEAYRKMGDGWRVRLNKFCEKKMGVSALEFCDIEQFKQVWAFLRNVREAKDDLNKRF